MTTRDPSRPEHAALPLDASNRADPASHTNTRSPSNPAALEGTDSDTRHVTDDFELPVAWLQDAESGRGHAGRIADALGVPLADFASIVGMHGRVIDETPGAAELQAPLSAFANIVAMVQDYMGDDADRMRTWLSQPQSRLGHRTPLAALCTPGLAVLVEQWLAS